MAEVEHPGLAALRPRALPAALLERGIKAVGKARAHAVVTNEQWQDAFFAAHPPAVDQLIQLESNRRDAAHRFNVTRRHFLPMRARLSASVDWAIASEQSVMARWGRTLTEPEQIFVAPSPLPTVVESASVPGPICHESWLRFMSPRLGDIVHARVYSPDARDPPTLIYGHGVGVEGEQWRGAIEEAAGLAERGIRVVRAEAPWHGRRRPKGSFGGEPMFARGPEGSLDMLAGQVGEIATMIAWARATSSGPIAIGGMSLGALAAQLALDHARRWPRELRPDAAILCGTCDRLDAVMMSGTLPLAIGLPDAVMSAGWSLEALHRWRGLLEPRGEPAVDPANLVALIGRQDRVMPFAHAKAMMERWRVPDDNLFMRDQGHFGLALGLVADPAPMHRLAQILHRLSAHRPCATLH
jgi:pimeloyl-ACP methyl ester carboxylesterase